MRFLLGVTPWQAIVISLFCHAFIKISCSNDQDTFNLNKSYFESVARDRITLEILKFQILMHKKPSTIWLLDGRTIEESQSDFLWGSSETDTDSNFQVPLIQGNFSKTIRNLHPHLCSFIFVVFVPSDPANLQNLVNEVQTNGNVRRDRYLFLGPEKMLDSLFRNPLIIRLRDKLGFSLDTQQILMDTESYDPSGVMMKFSDLAQMKPKPLMGQNFRGRHLRITGTLLPPWLYPISGDANSKVGKIQYDGSNYRMMFESGKKYNFTFEIYAPPDQGYGTLLKNGTWIGLVADIYYTERKFDLAILLGHVIVWYPLIDFAGTLGFANLFFLIRHPQLDINWEAFFNPFTGPVWGIICGAYVIVAFSMFILLHFRNRSSNFKPHMTLSMEIRQAFGVPYSIALEQNVQIPQSIRTLSVLWMITVIITGIGYKCNLASFLSSPSIVPIPSTYEELAAATDYKVILNNLGVAETSFFETSESPTIQTIKKRLKFNPDPVDCSREALVEPKTACIAWSPCIESFAAASFTINTRLNPLIVSKQPALPVSMSIAFPKDSPLVDSFIPITNTIYESGIYNKWTEEAHYYHKTLGKQKMLNATGTQAYTKLKEDQDSLGTGELKPFSIKNLKFSFFILGFGLTFAVVLVTYEILGCEERFNCRVKNQGIHLNPIKVFVNSFNH